VANFRQGTWVPPLTGPRGCHRKKGENILQGQGKVREFYFESGKIDVLKKSQGKLK